MSPAVKPMPRQKSTGPELEGVKVEKTTLDKARIAFTWLKGKLPENERKRFMLATYLSQCIRGERSATDDYAAFIREEGRRLGK